MNNNSMGREQPNPSTTAEQAAVRFREKIGGLRHYSAPLVTALNIQKTASGSTYSLDGGGGPGNWDHNKFGS